MFHKILLISTIALASAFPKDDPARKENLEPIQASYPDMIEQNDRNNVKPDQRKERVKTPLQQEPNEYGMIQYLEPQLQYPVYNQQAFPRIQPSILFYGAGGQGQPILINPGSPPGNFLVPQQPGTNVFVRENPQTSVFVGGYPNPKPAHIPPIEKDAEEIPTNPSSIPPLASSNPQDKKPEKLETFNEDKTEEQAKTAEEAGNIPQPIARTNLKPGQRFFILNGKPLYQNYPINFPEDLNREQINYNGPVQTLLFRNVPNFNQQSNIDLPVQGNEEVNQQNLNTLQNQNDQRYNQNYPPLYPQNLLYLRGSSPNLVQLNEENVPQEQLLRENFPENEANPLSLGQFRFTPSNYAYFPFGDDPQDDSVVVNAANIDQPNDFNQQTSNQDIVIPATKLTDPSTAQASPGAVALAGPGGTAGAAPKATALAGVGGLAVSSPKATAIAGTKSEEKGEKETKRKQEDNKKPARKPKN